MMSSSSYGRPFPSTAYWLSLIGGVLIALGGIVEVAEGIVYSSVIDSLVPGATAVIIALGAVALLFGVIIIVMGLRLKSHPESARSSGILILVLSLISFIGGGGYFIGLILGLIGGILAITWRPPASPQSSYGQPIYGSQVGASTVAPMQSGSGQRVCSHCGSPNVPGAQFCTKCGAPMS